MAFLSHIRIYPANPLTPPPPLVGFAARTHIGDPPFLSASEQLTIDDIPTKPLAALLSLNLTDDTTHPAAYYNPEYSILEDHGTSHSSVVDGEGMAVTITSRCVFESLCSCSVERWTDGVSGLKA